MPKVLDTAQDVFNAFGIDEDDVAFGAGEEKHSFTPVSEATVEKDEPEAAKQQLPVPPSSLKLSKAYEVKGISFDRIDLRAPRGVDFWELGEVSEWQFTSDRLPIRIIRNDILREYALRSIRAEPQLKAIDMLEALNLTDARAVRKAVLDFFSEEPSALGR